MRKDRRQAVFFYTQKNIPIKPSGRSWAWFQIS